MADYPGAITSFATLVDYVDYVLASHQNARAAEIVAIETYIGTNPQGNAASLKARIAHILNDDGYLDFDTSTEKTISVGSITPTQNWHTVDTEADAASDDLDTIVASGVTDGFVLFLRANNTARTVVIKNGTGNIFSTSGADITLDETYKFVVLIYDATLTKWLAFSASSSEQVSMNLVTGLADGAYSGLYVSGTAGTTLAFGDLVYFSVTDSRWELAAAYASASAGPVKLGICVLAAALDGDPTKILLYGNVRADASFPVMTIGAPLYISETAGNIAIVAPSTGDIVRIVGYGNTVDELFFCPDNTFVELPVSVKLSTGVPELADGAYSGLYVSGTAGATLAFGDLIYFSITDSRWELTDADAAATAGPVKLGICVLAAALDGDPTKILLYGNVRKSIAFPTMTIGAPLYVGVTAGDVEVTAPSGTGDIVRIVGYGNTADELFFCPDNTFVELV